MVGTIVGTYRLEERLGDGGLGAVYRAVDGGSGKEAAFRIFAREVSADAVLADRLRAMAPALKKLQHPNIAAFFELVSLGADLALFLEFVPGASLDKVRPPAGRLDTAVAVSCAVQVLRALEFAHSAGVLHHALRPSNVMVTRQGTVKVLDFGIGHAFGANRKTREDRLLGVLAYLAPEQLQNQPGDARADIYAVGVLLYELLTGRLPFDHRTEFALRQAHLAEPPAAPRTIVPGLPEWLDQAVIRALAKNPSSRYQNATEFRAVLEAALGLSTSREAAIVRQRDGAQVETFAAAPPIPPLAAARPGGPAEADATAAAPVQPPLGPPRADLAETVPAAVPAAAEIPARSRAVPPAPSTRAARRAPALAFAVVILIVGVGAVGVYFATRRPMPPAAEVAPVQTPADAPAAAAPAAPAVAPVETAAAPAPSPVASQPSPAGAAGAVAPPARKPKPAAARQAPTPGEGAALQGAPPAAPQGAPPAAPPPDASLVPAAPVSPPAAAEKLADVSYRKVKLVAQAGSSERTTDVVLLFSDDRLIVTPAGGGAALRTLRYAEITAASYSKAQRKRLGFISSSQHLLDLETSGEPLLLRLDKDNVEAILAAIALRSGKAVTR